MLDAPFECAIVTLADDDVHVPVVVVDQRLTQRGEISGHGILILAFPHWQEHHRLAGFQRTDSDRHLMTEK